VFCIRRTVNSPSVEDFRERTSGVTMVVLFPSFLRTFCECCCIGVWESFWVGHRRRAINFVAAERRLPRLPAGGARRNRHGREVAAFEQETVARRRWPSRRCDCRWAQGSASNAFFVDVRRERHHLACAMVAFDAGCT